MVAVLVLLTAVIAPALQIGQDTGDRARRPSRASIKMGGDVARHHPATRTWNMIERS
jgi:hypothetical protein